MTKISPCGTKLIVEPVAAETFTTEGNIELVNLDLSEGIIVEVGSHLKDVFKKGDRIIYPTGTKATTIPYLDKPHLFLDGRPPSDGGDVWAVVTQDK